eukprot:TRINITY_DN13730_c0_g1_i1.p1 TRINITY_DN13730_c0_g1~~TRINITY_DN13730_c0_g1_i1.p1  ORF type:complete len:611 (-),score=69.13 TRINITY_DN13730_c0_g1_i1:394-1998(-)
MYHWGPIDLCIRPALLGYVPEDLMKFLVANGGTNVAGGGFYVADQPFGTSYYGSCRIDVHVPVGTPVTREDDDAILSQLLRTGFERKMMSTLGDTLPLIYYHYMLTWSVFYNYQSLSNVSSASVVHFHEDIYDTFFSRMYPAWKGPETGPQIDAINQLVAALRRIVLSIVGSENILHWAVAFLESPQNIGSVLRPNSTMEDWRQLERYVVQAFSSNLTAKYSPGIDKLPTFVDVYTREVLPTIIGGPTPIEDLSAVFRDYPYSETVYASEEYLSFLQKHPLVTVVSVSLIGNFSFTKWATFNTSFYEVHVRGLSAYGADWKKPFMTGFLPEDDPILKLLTNPTICCEANKTQLLIQRTLTAIATMKHNDSKFEASTEISYLSWLLPMKESVVPKWVSRSLVKVAVDAVSVLRRHYPSKKMENMAYSEPIFYFVSETVASSSFVSNRWYKSNLASKGVAAALEPALGKFGPAAMRNGEMPDLTALLGLIDPVAASQKIQYSLKVQDLKASSPLAKAVKANNWPLVFAALFDAVAC